MHFCKLVISGVTKGKEAANKGLNMIFFLRSTEAQFNIIGHASLLSLGWEIKARTLADYGTFEYDSHLDSSTCPHVGLRRVYKKSFKAISAKA